MASSPQYALSSSGPASLASTANVREAIADHALSPQHSTAGPLYPWIPSDTWLYYGTSSPQYALSGSGIVYALIPTADISAVTADHVLAPEAEHPHHPPQPFYAVSSPRHELSGLGPAYTLASSGIYPSLPAGPISLLTSTSQPSAVASGEQHQEIVEESGPSTADSNPESLLRHQMLAQSFWEIQIHARCAGYPGPFVEQRIYVPYTKRDRLRYVTLAELEPPIIFMCINPEEDGIHLVDALQPQTRRLVAHDEPVFINRGPSISLRLEWRGYDSWSAQMPTRNFKATPGPVTLAKLAKNIAKHVKRFIEKHSALETYSDARWRVGGVNGIRFEDLTLVSLHHVSQGSWQPQLRLRRAL